LTAAFAVIGDGLTAPRSLPESARELTNVLGWLPVPPAWASSIHALAVMGSPELRGGFESGRLRYLPVRYSALARLLAGPLRPTVAVITARPAGHGLRFSGCVGYGLIAAAMAGEVAVEVDETLPEMDAPEVRVRGRLIVMQAPTPAPTAPSPELVETDLAIGRVMAGLVPKGATVQYGPGSIGEASITALQVPVRIHSGIVTEATADLARRGLLLGAATAAYMNGRAGLNELARSGQIRLRGVEETHSLETLAGLRRFVALNTALQVGLDGSVNVERIGATQVGGIGGHSDFCRAAAASLDGLSVIGLRSIRGSKSTIVPRVDVVSTTRSDVDIVVTEWGLADLRGLDNRSRSMAIVGIAEPRFRDELEASLSGV
jgi:hypothetical protein